MCSCSRVCVLLRGVLLVINWLFPTERSGIRINYRAVAENLYQAVLWGLCFSLHWYPSGNNKLRFHFVAEFPFQNM